jgi:hypothetical protein
VARKRKRLAQEIFEEQESWRILSVFKEHFLDFPPTEGIAAVGGHIL